MIDGLKPYPAMKDSGVPWLVDLPRHWKVSSIKRLARAGYKTFVDGDWIESPFIRSEGIRLIQTGNIGLGSYREKGFRYIDEETFRAFGCTEFQPKDVLICRLGEPVGRSCLAEAREIASVGACSVALLFLFRHLPNRPRSSDSSTTPTFGFGATFALSRS